MANFVNHLPSAFSITFGLLDSRTATQELVVPRSIPMMLMKENLIWLGACLSQGREQLRDERNESLLDMSQNMSRCIPGEVASGLA